MAAGLLVGSGPGRDRSQRSRDWSITMSHNQPPPPPGNHGPAYPPPGVPQYAQPAPPKKKSKLPWIIGGSVALVLLCCGGAVAISGGGDSEEPATDAAVSHTNTAPASATKSPAKAPVEPPANSDDTPGLNESARDGKFEFRVSGVDCGATEVGPEALSTKAQGMFCLVAVSVKNIGDRAQMFDGSSQKALDAQGTQFSHDGAAAFYANEGNNTFLEQINPGNTKGRLIFDVPEGTKLTAMELHDSPFSGGVKVSLS
jgi:hypothetical protein